MCFYLRRCPFEIITIWDCVPCGSYPFAVAIIRDGIHSKFCPFGIVYIWYRVHFGLRFSGLCTECGWTSILFLQRVKIDEKIIYLFYLIISKTTLKCWEKSDLSLQKRNYG